MAQSLGHKYEIVRLNLLFECFIFQFIDVYRSQAWSLFSDVAAGVFVVRQDFHFLFLRIRGQANRLQDP